MAYEDEINQQQWSASKTMKRAIINFLGQIPFATWILIFIPLPLFCIIILPWPDMDEFLPYHRIACTEYPLAIEHIFRESCSAHPAKFFNIEFFRSYSYVGVSTNYIYKPFFKILPSIFSHYLLGILVVCTLSIALAKVMRLKISTALIPLLYFPLVFQAIHDTGPIRISLLAYPFMMYSALKLINPDSSGKEKIVALLLLFFSIAIPLESKPFFLYLIPQIILISFGFAWASACKNYINIRILEAIWIPNRIKKNAWLVTVISTIGLAIYLVLFCLKVPDDSYISFLISNAPASRDVLSELKIIRDFVFFPLMFVNKIYHVNRHQQILSGLFYLPIIYIVYLYLKKNIFGCTLILSNIFLIISFLITKNAWSGHHFIFLHLPILIILMNFANISSKNFKWVTLSLIFIIFYCSSQLVLNHLNDTSGAERFEIFKRLNNERIASNSIINFSSWGGYYIQSLYGQKTQLVTYIEPLTFEDAQKLEAIAIRLKKNSILNICNKCMKNEILNIFPNRPIERMSNENSNWVIWKISLN